MKQKLSLLIALLLPTVALADVYIYPNKGQSQQQQSKDRYECHTWAVQQTGFDPTKPQTAQAPSAPPPGKPVVKGAVRGAAVGAVGGAIAGDAGTGAAAGAAVGIRGDAGEVVASLCAALADRARHETTRGAGDDATVGCDQHIHSGD